MTEQQTATFDQWAIVDVMGHQRYAGRVTEQVIAGHGFIRVDVPESGTRQPYSKLLSPGAIHSITPCSEETARIAARSIQCEPVNEWDVRRAGYQLPASDPVPAGHDDDEEFL